jgi:hypothetical protein
MIHPILVIALMCIVVILLLRITMRTPVVSGLLEQFVSHSLLNSVTECPAGYSMYMYDGAAYCCKGTVNTDAPSLKRTCIALPTDQHPFCTLGPGHKDVPNCAAIHKKALKDAGGNVCPPSMPNFCKGSSTGSVGTGAGRCCTSAITEDGMNCVDSTGSCSVGAGKNEFLDPTDCRFLRQKEMDSTCPAGYYQSVSSVNNAGNPMNGLTLYGCTNLSNNCYTEKLVRRLYELGYDASQLRQCQ